jgi:hypothetical protein
MYNLESVVNDFLDHIKVNIFSGSGVFLRDLRTFPYSNGLEFGKKSVNPWLSAFIRCDDAEKYDLIDMKADIIFGLYFAVHNQDQDANHWGDVPVLVCDTFYAGAYIKRVEFDGLVIHVYDPGVLGSSFRWIHYNILTKEIKAL